MPGTAIPPARTRRRFRKRLRKLSRQSALSLFARRLHVNALLLLGGLIAYLSTVHGLHLLGWTYAGPGRFTAALLLAGLMAAAALEAAVEAWWRRPTRETVARGLDRTLGLDDRVAAAWSCLAAGRDDDVAQALVLRASERTVALDPVALYPVRHQRYVWYVLLAAIGLIVILPYGSSFGLLPIIPGPAETGPLPTAPLRGERASVAETGRAAEPEPEPDRSEEADPEEPAPPRELQTEVYPELPSYTAKGPVPMTARVQAKNEDPRPVSGEILVRVDEGPFVSLPGKVEIPGGREFDRLRSFDLRQAIAETGGLSGGVHRVQVAFQRDDGSEPEVSEEVEFFVEPAGGGGGGGGEDDEPQDQEEPEDEPPPPPPPPPAGGEPPPPEPPPVLPDAPPPSLLVKPLFREGETVTKVGPTLQFDPAAPRGTPPRERPLDEVFPELRRRAEDAVSRDEVPPEWRRLVRRYFDLIRPR